jgi:hypothetical protein
MGTTIKIAGQKVFARLIFLRVKVEHITINNKPK